MLATERDREEHVVEWIALAVVLLGVLIASLSTRMRRWPVSEPLLALLAGVALGPAVLGLVDLPPLTEDVATARIAAELLLAVSVMPIAFRYPWATVVSRRRDVAILLLAVMPLMAAATAGVAWLTLGIGGALALRRLPWLLLFRPALRLRWRDAVFLGWFGPIGVSAVLYLTTVFEDLSRVAPLVAAGAAVVVASTAVHGLSAAPARLLYVRAASADDDERDRGREEAASVPSGGRRADAG